MSENIETKLRELEGKSKESPEAKTQYRIACIQYGKPELAGLEVGDVVEVNEAAHSPWINGTWTGEIMKINGSGEKYVRPLSDEQNWRIKPSCAEYAARGLYLAGEDRAVLKIPSKSN